VLAYLATASDHRASREELIDEIWSEEDRETIDRNFHPTLSRLRRDLRGGAAAADEDLEPLLHREGFYELDPSLGWWIDLEEMTRFADRGRALAEAGRHPDAVELYEAAWHLYRGPLLEGVYDAWATRRRESAQRRHLAVLRELGDLYERLGRRDDAVDAYRALLTEDPLQERVHVALMRIYSLRGRRDLVRRQYERLTRLLRNELGVEPLPETADEYHRLMIERG
jgi:DNA-binding SARP family transcriptional activator